MTNQYVYEQLCFNDINKALDYVFFHYGRGDVKLSEYVHFLGIKKSKLYQRIHGLKIATKIALPGARKKLASLPTYRWTFRFKLNQFKIVILTNKKIYFYN